MSCIKNVKIESHMVQDMNGTYTGNGDTMGETVNNHIDPAPGMLRKDNSPIFGRSNIGKSMSA